MAHKKAGGSTKNGRESESTRLGLKKFGGEAVVAGNIIVRQRGTAYRAGENVGVGTDHTLFALTDGTVQFKRKGVDQRVHVSVEPSKGCWPSPLPHAGEVAPQARVRVLLVCRTRLIAKGLGTAGAFLFPTNP